MSLSAHAFLNLECEIDTKGKHSRWWIPVASLWVVALVVCDTEKVGTREIETEVGQVNLLDEALVETIGQGQG